MSERMRSATNYEHYSNNYPQNAAKMGGSDLSPRKTILILAIVVGCFAVLWPKVFHPMLVGSAQQQMKPNALDKRAGCCDVISEIDVDTIQIFSELCKSIIDKHNSTKPMSGQEVVQLCRNEVLKTCGIDISAVLQEQVRLGRNVKQILNDVRSLNGSLCLKYNYGVSPWRLGITHRVILKPTYMASIRQERPPHIKPEMMHPAFRERGRAIPQPHKDSPIRSSTRVVEGRPGPVPGLRPTIGGAGHVVQPSKQGTNMGLIMPAYTIGIVIFFTYTLMKILFKKQPTGPGGNLYPPVEPNLEFRREVFESDKSQLASRFARDGATSKLVVNAMSALLDEVDQELEARRKAREKSAQDGLALNGKISNGSIGKSVSEDQPSVTVMGMEMTASCEGGQKWTQLESPVLPSPHATVVEPSVPPQEIFLEGALPAQSQLLVSDSATEAQKNQGDDPAVVLAGKVTLSVINVENSEDETIPSESDKVAVEARKVESDDEALLRIDEAAHKIELIIEEKASEIDEILEEQSSCKIEPIIEKKVSEIIEILGEKPSCKEETLDVNTEIQDQVKSSEETEAMISSIPSTELLEESQTIISHTANQSFKDILSSAVEEIIGVIDMDIKKGIEDLTETTTETHSQESVVPKLEEKNETNESTEETGLKESIKETEKVLEGNLISEQTEEVIVKPDGQFESLQEELKTLRELDNRAMDEAKKVLIIQIPAIETIAQPELKTEDVQEEKPIVETLVGEPKIELQHQIDHDHPELKTEEVQEEKLVTESLAGEPKIELPFDVHPEQKIEVVQEEIPVAESLAGEPKIELQHQIDELIKEAQQSVTSIIADEIECAKDLLVEDKEVLDEPLDNQNFKVAEDDKSEATTLQEVSNIELDFAEDINEVSPKQTDVGKLQVSHESGSIEAGPEDKVNERLMQQMLDEKLDKEEKKTQAESKNVSEQNLTLGTAGISSIEVECDWETEGENLELDSASLSTNDLVISEENIERVVEGQEAKELQHTSVNNAATSAVTVEQENEDEEIEEDIEEVEEEEIVYEEEVEEEEEEDDIVDKTNNRASSNEHSTGEV